MSPGELGPEGGDPSGPPLRWARKGEVRLLGTLEEELLWKTSSGQEMRGRPGDLLIEDRSGRRTIGPTEFAKTYRVVEDDRYERTGTVWAVRADPGELIESREGPQVAVAGDWVVIDDDGNSWLVPDDHFTRSYVPAQQDPGVEALAADREGDLDLAARLVTKWNLTLASRGSIRELGRSFRLRAKILRHRRESHHLRHAVDSAEQALRVATLPGAADGQESLALAELELAACLVAAGDHDEVEAMLRPWLHHAAVPVSGWAWVLLGQHQDQLGDPLRAVACFQNAMAEFDRAHHPFRSRTARISLASTLNRAGRVNDAHRILAEDRKFWSAGEPELRRTTVAFRIVAAANHFARGDIPDAMADLDEASRELELCSGLDFRVAEVAALRADCLREWGQLDRARAALSQAGGEMPDLPGEVRNPASQPLSLPAMVNLSEPPQRPRHDPAPPQGPGTVEPVTERTRRATRRVLRDAESLGVHDPPEVRAVVEAVEALGGVPGLERYEARALRRAGELLRHAQGDVAKLGRSRAETLFRRCLVRAQQLPHMELLQARAQIGLAHVLSERGAEDEALRLVVEGLRGLDLERFDMLRRDFRQNWLRAEVNPAYELAIRLAAPRDVRLAADLIIFSRTAGLVVTDGDNRRPTAGEVPLRPMPRLIHIDGEQSILGSDGVCHFR